MIARAPGKLVLSGAYAVLDGAPAIVSAVDRWVVADATRPAELVTPEVRAAIGEAPAPWFDASALRGPRGKLGLGSSAAILVASLAALELARGGPEGDAELAQAVLEPALRAHRRAQGGGSGIDVAASARGGTLIAEPAGELLRLEAVALPAGLSFRVWSAGEPASTAELVGRVRALAEREAAHHAALLGPLCEAARRARDAVRTGDGRTLLEALSAQLDGLVRLGDAAGAPIVTPAVRTLAELARREDAIVIPSGAGGGDVALFVGPLGPSAALLELAHELGHEPLELALGARGVHAVPRESRPSTLQRPTP